jgi:hypothetical protein
VNKTAQKRSAQVDLLVIVVVDVDTFEDGVFLIDILGPLKLGVPKAEVLCRQGSRLSQKWLD